MDRFNSVKDIDSKLFEKVSDMGIKIENLKVSKDAFKEAKEYIDDEKYRDAILLLLKVIDTDKNYEEAQNLLKESTDSATNSVLAEAEEYFNKGNFVKAFDVLEDEILVSQNKQVVEEKLKELKEKQITKFLEEATKLASENKWKEAKTKLENALEIDENNKEVKDKIAEYEKKMPITLGDLKVLNNKLTTKIADRMTDNYGTEWNSVVEVQGHCARTSSVYNPSTHTSSYKEYNLEQKYKTLVGTLIVKSQTLTEEAKLQIKIYADGKELGTYNLDRNTKPIELNLNLDYAKVLKISVSGELGETGTTQDFYVGFANTYVRND
jgi:tetratricopeptide (TPR) repeat protein